MTPIIKTLNLGSKILTFKNFACPKRCLTLSRCSSMPYMPEERPPLTDHKKKLYPQVEQEFTEEGYPILKIMPKNRNIFEERTKLTRRQSRYTYPSRGDKMAEDQDWPSVWSKAKTFVPSTVPLPLRLSYEDKKGRVPRGKYANTELLKIANFLHLTPGAIEQHCKAIRKFCTDWPQGLSSDEEVKNHFPVTYVTRDYVHSSPTIRDVRARIVELKVNIEDLHLAPLDKDKLRRLAAHRYDAKTGEIIITACACPSKVQNQDYAEYLLTALYFESITHEKWEDEKPECDWERFFWERSESKSKVKNYLTILKPNIKDEVIEKGDGDDVIEEYKRSLEKIYQNENYDNLEVYRSSVEKLLGFSGNSVF